MKAEALEVSCDLIGLGVRRFKINYRSATTGSITRMGMYDEYETVPAIPCPICDARAKYQGKYGPNALFLWRQGEAHPVDQVIDEDARIDPVRYSEFWLPEAFDISGFCENGHVFTVGCRCQGGTWTDAEIKHPG